MNGFIEKDRYDIRDLLDIMCVLRSPGGCPWDIEQTHATIRNNMLEEAYEAVEAIDLDNSDMLCEELGDVLLQVVFHCRMSAERGEFDFDAVCDGICKKLIRRHPHIFGTVKADTAQQVLDNWAAIKKVEKGNDGVADVMDSVAKSLPALMRAQKIAKTARKAGLEEKITDTDGARERIGELLWQAVRLSDAAGLDAEELLTAYVNGYVDGCRK